MTADRPATEPRTEAGRTMRTLLMDMYTAWAFIIDANGIEVDEMPDDPLPLIFAIEEQAGEKVLADLLSKGYTRAEAAQGAAPLLRSREEEMAIRMAKPIADLFGSLPAHDPAICRRCVPRAEGLREALEHVLDVWPAPSPEEFARLHRVLTGHDSCSSRPSDERVPESEPSE